MCFLMYCLQNILIKLDSYIKKSKRLYYFIVVKEQPLKIKKKLFINEGYTN